MEERQAKSLVESLSLDLNIMMPSLQYIDVENMMACFGRLTESTDLRIELHWQDDVDSRNAWHLIELIWSNVAVSIFRLAWVYHEINPPQDLMVCIPSIKPNHHIHHLDIDLRETNETYYQEAYDPLSPVMCLSSWLPLSGHEKKIKFNALSSVTTDHVVVAIR